MRHESIDGLVIRAKDTGENDRYLSVLTAERGRIPMLSKGGKSIRGEQRAVAQLFTYANFEYYRRGDFNILKGGVPIRAFYGVSAELDRLNLAAYLCDVCCEITDEGEAAGDILRLVLNSLYAISEARYPIETVKAVFELRAAFLSGYAPTLDGCAECGCEEGERMYIDVMNGALVCSECLHAHKKVHDGGAYDEIREAEVLLPLSPALLAAWRFLQTAPIERMFSFALQDEEDKRLFSQGAQTYLLSHLGRGFDTLNFYHAMRQETKGNEHELFRKNTDNT